MQSFASLIVDRCERFLKNPALAHSVFSQVR
jgi:hypothetical protein